MLLAKTVEPGLGPPGTDDIELRVSDKEPGQMAAKQSCGAENDDGFSQENGP